MTKDIIDICISFDTTGSMYPCLTRVRREINTIVEKLFEDIPILRISIIVHGDYCDELSTYTIKYLDFTKNKKEIINFVNNAEHTFGGDFPECYELVLNYARTKLNWLSGTSKVLVIIGDSIPHEVNYLSNRKKIDWKNEIGLLNEFNVKIYGVHAMSGIRNNSKYFYKEISEKTGGLYLTLDQLSTINDLIMAICYKQYSNEAFNNYLDQIKNNSLIIKNFQNNTEIERLGKRKKLDDLDNFNAVPSGRFQVLEVNKDIKIKDFIKENGIEFKSGRGFYQLTKSENIGQYKEIILINKVNGDIFNGDNVRNILNLSPQTKSKGKNEKLNFTYLEKYDIFIQSKSYNRSLPKGTKLLYEVHDWDINK
jgi:hypothetical protein